MHEIEKEILYTQAQQMLLEYAQRLNHDEDRQILLDEVVNRHDKLQSIWKEIQKNQASIVQGESAFRETESVTVPENMGFKHKAYNRLPKEEF